MFTTVYIGLGANLLDPVQNVIDAKRLLVNGDNKNNSLQSSSLYLSSPVGYEDQPYFVNCVVALSTEYDCQSLFDLMQYIENKLGRTRDKSNQNAARSIDLDLLLFGDQIIESSNLIVPHPRISERLFVLQPLAELKPELKIPNLGHVGDLIVNGRRAGLFDDQALIKLG